MKKVVQEEVSVEKCDKCDEYGHIEVMEDTGTTYLPFCKCEYGQWQKTRETPGDMFYRGRHGL